MQQLLLLHGAIGSANQFEQFVPLLEKKYKVSSINFSGHGGNPIPLSDFSIALFAKDVLHWLDSNNIKTIDIVGYSMGGYVALYLAKHYPDRVGKIFTLATKFDWTPEGASKEAAMLNADKISEKVPIFAKKLEHIHGADNWKLVLNKTAEMMLALGQKPTLTLTDLSEIKHTVLLSVGDKDMMVSLEETIAMYRSLKNAQLLVLPNTQHAFEKVNLNTLSQAVINFMS
jgi:pimeloyl-ACP methyl ester carboxylesterase